MDGFLTKLINAKKDHNPITIIGIHDAISAKIASNIGFDSFWVSGLGVALTHAKPDANILSHTEVSQIVSYISESISSRPDTKKANIIVDVDTGHGEWAITLRFVRELRKAGATGIVIEDKKFPKRNSFQNNSSKNLEDVGIFCHKLEAIKKKEPDLFLAARLEGYTTNSPIEDTLSRAKMYVKAGADALVVHSKSSNGNQIREFINKFDIDIPIIIIPTTYYKDIAIHGVSGIIIANQIMRYMISALTNACQTIKSGDINPESIISIKMASLEEVFELTDDKLLNGLLKDSEEQIVSYNAEHNQLIQKEG